MPGGSAVEKIDIRAQGLLGEERLPEPWGQSLDPVRRLNAHALEHIDQVGKRIDAVETAGDQQCDWTMATCLAPSSVQQNSQFSRPIGIARRALSRWLVSIGTS